jgi:hypothetical protein
MTTKIKKDNPCPAARRGNGTAENRTRCRRVAALQRRRTLITLHENPPENGNGSVKKNL